MPIAALLFVASACDPGETCSPVEGAFPDGVDPCDPTTYPGTSPNDGGAPVDVADGGDAAAPGDATANYPPGPYGTDEGATLLNLAMTTTAGETFSFSADVFADPQVRLVLVSTGAGWCTACREEQPALEALYQTHAQDGLLVIAAIFEDDVSAPVTPAFARGWQEQYGLSFPVLIDEFNDFAAFYDPGLAPMNMFVDGETMQIIDIAIGALDGARADAIIGDRL